MEKIQVATEWDMCWFCDHCGKMMSWKSKGYREGNKVFCQECSELPYLERSKLHKSSHSGKG